MWMPLFLGLKAYVRSLMSDGRGDNLYDLNGRKLQQKPTRKGVYILNGSKVVVK